MRKAHALPNTTMSRRELAPRRFAPCTEAQAASPAAKSPGTIASWSVTLPSASFLGLITW